MTRPRPFSHLDLEKFRDLAKIRAELENRLTEEQFSAVKALGRAPLTMRRRAERARFGDEAHYFDFLVARAIRDGRNEQQHREQTGQGPT